MVRAIGVNTTELLKIWNLEKKSWNLGKISIILKRANSATWWVKKIGSKGLIILFYFMGVDRNLGTNGRMLILGRRRNDFSGGKSIKGKAIHGYHNKSLKSSI